MARTSKGAVMRFIQSLGAICFLVGFIGLLGLAGNEELDIFLILLFSVPFLIVMCLGGVLASWHSR